MFAARTLVRRRGGVRQRQTKRLLHLEANEAQTFLSSRLPSAQIVGSGGSGAGSSSSSKNNSLSILLHADRRPQRLSNDTNEKPFFGPSLLVCQSTLLNQNNAQGLGKGDLGLLKAQRDTPDQVVHAPIRYEQGLTEEQATQVLEAVSSASDTRMSPQAKQKAVAVLTQLWTVFKETEGIWFTGTIALQEDGGVLLESPFLEFDDFAVHRIDALKEVHQAWQARRDSNTAQAEDGGLFYIKLHNGGKVGSFGYGAGNAMATMDGLAMAGATPANFLDGGGGANVANAKLAIETLNRDPDVKSIFVNTFGGLTRCSLVAEGIIQAIRENNIEKPMTVRVMGTEAEEANELLRASGLLFTIEEDFKRAARLAVDQAR